MRGLHKSNSRSEYDGRKALSVCTKPAIGASMYRNFSRSPTRLMQTLASSWRRSRARTEQAFSRSAVRGYDRREASWADQLPTSRQRSCLSRIFLSARQSPLERKRQGLRSGLPVLFVSTFEPSRRGRGVGCGSLWSQRSSRKAVARAVHARRAEASTRPQSCMLVHAAAAVATRR